MVHVCCLFSFFDKLVAVVVVVILVINLLILVLEVKFVSCIKLDYIQSYSIQEPHLAALELNKTISLDLTIRKILFIKMSLKLY